MAGIFMLFFVLTLFSLYPLIACPCPPPLSCAKNKIPPPLLKLSCDANYTISCTSSNPDILFNKQKIYTIRNINHTDNTIILVDWVLSLRFNASCCTFLYEFQKCPLLGFCHSHDYDNLFNCKNDHYFFHDTFHELHNLTFCGDYNVSSYIADSKTCDDIPNFGCLPYCVLFEWKLQFGEDSDDISILAAGSSNNTHLLANCLNLEGRRGHPIARKKILIGLTATIGGILAVCTFIFLFLSSYRNFRNSVFFWKRKRGNALAIENFLRTYGSLAPKRYTYAEVKKMTKSFSEKLGQGGYGMVFKGMLPDGRQVAVKLLSMQKGDGQDFINEVSSIGRTSHINIVCLVGFCLEGSQKALIYEFMPNGSLEKYIGPNKTKGLDLSWEKLYEIAISVARGLEYLHRGCNTRIVHFDIKPHNILLDENFCPKISDFGLSKLCGTKDSILSMADARGTIGYIAPEVFSRNFGTVSSKSDVYSYGMMVLEMVGGRRNLQASANNSSELYFPHWIYEHLDCNGGLQSWEVTNETEEIVRKMIIVGLWCIQTMPVNRPSISRVVEMLSGCIKDLKMPPKLHLASPEHPITNYSGKDLIQLSSTIEEC